VNRTVLYAALAIIAFFGFFPIYWMLLISLTPNEEVFAFPPRFLPGSVTFEHYANFFGNGQLLRYMLNSVIVASATKVGSLIVSTYAAYSFSKFRYRGRRALMYLVLSSQMLPTALLLITLYLMFDRLGLLNTYLALILSFTTFTLPLCIWLLKGYFDNIPTELIEAAKVDGAKQWTIIHRVLLPVAAPGLVAARLFAFIKGWNDFILALTLAGPGQRTLPPGLVLTFLGEAQAAWADLMAASLIVSLPLIVAFMVVQRYLVEGLTSGAVKG
jgi:multiple sugar transport system permease protein